MQATGIQALSGDEGAPGQGGAPAPAAGSGLVVPWVSAGVVGVLGALHLWAAGGGVPEVDVLVRLGAKVGPLIRDGGEWWRLASANLLHRSAGHLALNALLLLYVGLALESVYRGRDYALLLGVAGLGTMTSSLAFTPEVSVGASGLVHGGLGALLVVAARRRAHLPPGARWLYAEAILPTVLVVLWVGASAAGVDTAGHLGGLGAGALCGLCLEPRGRPVAPVRRALPPLGVLALSVLAAWPRWRTLHDAQAGLSVVVPVGWREETGAPGVRVFSNGLPGRGQARFSLERLEEGEEGGSEGLARRLRERGLGPDAASGPVRVAGVPALRLRASLPGPRGPVQHEALLVPRGDWVYPLLFSYPADVPAYASVVERMVEGVRLEEPAVLLEARARALLVPGAARPLAALGQALRRWGQPQEALAPLAEALRLAPEDVATHAERVQALLQTGRPAEACEAARAALAYGPAEPAALEADARCALAHGEVARALERLAEARRLAPQDARLRAAEARLRDTATP